MLQPEAVDVLRRLDGAARARDLVAICGRGALRAAVQSGDVIRVAHGRYALPECTDPWLAALRLSGVISHVSAAQHWRLEVLARPTAPDVTVRRGRHHVDGRSVAVHWADLAATDLDERGRVTSPLRTVLDCARLLPFAQGLAIADSALRNGLVTRSELSAAAVSLAGAGRARVLSVTEAADGRAGSVLESATRAILIEGRVDGFVPQLVVRDETLYARVDLGSDAQRTVIEADSFEHHGTRAALADDCRRYDELVVRGWLVLRFAWEHVMFDPDWVLATVRATIALRDRRPLRGQNRL
jgi:very-short-patch-repair endonuclease